MKQNNNIFLFLSPKNKKVFKRIASTIIVTVILLNLCVTMIFINHNNIKEGLLDNNNLMFVQMFGYSKTKDTCILDTSLAEDIEHLVFITESCPLAIELVDEKGDSQEQGGLIVHKIDKRYSDYIGLENMKDGVIYSPLDGTQNVEQYYLEKPYDKLGIRLQNYGKKAPAVLAGEDFASIATYNRLREKSVEGEDYFLTPEYFIGVDRTDNVYSVIKNLKEIYSDYELTTFYQANGIETLVTGSKKMLKLQIWMSIVIIIVSGIIIQIMTASVIDSMEKELMIIHINGMSRSEMIKEFYKMLTKILRKSYIIPEIISLATFFVIKCYFSVYQIKWWQILGVLCINIIIIFMNQVLLKRKVKIRIYQNTSNENITRLIRN